MYVVLIVFIIHIAFVLQFDAPQLQMGLEVEIIIHL